MQNRCSSTSIVSRRKPRLAVEAAHALLAHARLLSNLLPEVDQTLRALVAAPSRQPFEETRELLARARAGFEVTAKRFRVLLYAVSLGLLVIALRLGQRLWTRTLRLRRLVDANIIGIFIWDFEGRILEANEAFLHMVGYDHEDLVAGRVRWTDLTPPEWRDRDARLLQDHRVTGSLRPFEKEYFRKDGSRVPVLIGVATFERSGTQGVAFVLDLTERKQADAVRQRLAAIVDSSADAIISKDLNGTIESWNSGAERLFGYQASEVIGKSILIIIPPDRHDEELEILERIRHGERIESYETVRMREDGSLLDISLTVSPIRDAAGGIIGASKIVRDITERKRAETALRDSEEALRRNEDWLAQAQRLSHTGNWVFNPTTMRYLYWSDESYRIWGFDPLQGIPSRDNVWQRIHPDDRAGVWEAVQEALRQQRGFVAEFRIVLPDGTVKYLEATTHHEFSPLGAPVEAVSTQVDVTERKRAQEEHERLRQLESDLAHMNRLSMMGELAASLAHEIAQPVATARNNARAAMHFLDRSPPGLGQIREALACVVDDADRAGNILDRIRDHIKKAPPRKERVDLNQAITDVIALAQDAIVENGVSIQTCLTERLPDVQVDCVQLQQVVLNLILNAVEAMSAVKKEARELSISTEPHHADGVLVAVRDSGPGIAPEHLDRVFDAFYTTKSSGVGMGLSICRSIINAHGGRLWADVNAPRGAVFQFTLPSAGKELTNPRPADHQIGKPNGDTAPDAPR